MTVLNNPRATSTSSLGLNHSISLDSKVRAAASHGFTGIEIVYGDLERYSGSQNLDMKAAARQVRGLCSTLGLQILSLCPFENFEGHPSPLQERLEKASRWLELARILGASYLQVPAQFGAGATGDEAVIVSELQQLADVAAALEPPIAIAYEPMSWSSFYPTWQSAVHLAQLVNREKFKICLDTFHIATKLWASPYSASGKYPDADRRLAKDLEDFIQDFPMDKLAYIQLSDASRLSPPFSTSHPWYTDGEASEFSWSKHGRPFPLESEYSGYLPMVELVRAWVMEGGFDGWVSMETFDHRTRDEGVTAEMCAVRAERSWRRLEKAIAEPKCTL